MENPTQGTKRGQTANRDEPQRDGGNERNPRRDAGKNPGMEEEE